MPNTDFDKLAQTLKFKKAESSPGKAVVHACAEEAFLNGVGIAHGGFLFALADYASALAVNTDSIVAVRSNSVINFINPCPRETEIVAKACVSYQNAKTAMCNVEISNIDASLTYASFQSRFIIKK